MKCSHEQFRQYVSRGIDALPERILKRLSNVAVVVEARPSEEQRKELGLRKNESLLGLYEGVPQTERGSSYSALPDKITIFKQAIERHAADEADIERLVTTTVWHEVAHHFGMDEEGVRKEEQRRGFIL